MILPWIERNEIILTTREPRRILATWLLIGVVVSFTYASNSSDRVFIPSEARPPSPGPPKLKRILPFDGLVSAETFTRSSKSVWLELGSV